MDESRILPRITDLIGSHLLIGEWIGGTRGTGFTAYARHTRNHERPNLRLFQEGWEPRSFQDRDEDAEHIARVRDMERRNKQAAQEFLPAGTRPRRNPARIAKKRTGTG